MGPRRDRAGEAAALSNIGEGARRTKRAGR